MSDLARELAWVNGDTSWMALSRQEQDVYERMAETAYRVLDVDPDGDEDEYADADEIYDRVKDEVLALLDQEKAGANDLVRAALHRIGGKVAWIEPRDDDP